MNVRNLSTVLWFAAGWSGAGLVVGFLGLPTPLALLGGLLVAALVRWEPTGRLWGTQRARIRPIEAVVAELDGQGAGASPVAGERTTF